MNKKELINTLRVNLNKTLEEFNERKETNHTMSDIDELNTLDPEDYSHQSEANEFEMMLNQQIKLQKANLSALDALPTTEMDKVQLGAIVETDKHNFYISFATTPFEFNGDEFLGISVNSPIYGAMENKTSSDEFSFSGVQYKIQKVY